MISAIPLVVGIAVFLGFGGYRVWTSFHRDPRIGKFLLGWFVASFVPTIAMALRPGLLQNAPFIVPVAVVGLTVLSLTVLRRLSPGAPILPDLIQAHLVRAPVGLLFLIAASFDRLEGGFATHAGWGDILVGVLAWGLSRRETSPPAWVHAWNALAVADLLYAIFLAVTRLLPWFASTGNVPSLGLLPFFGLPLFFSSSFLIFGTTRRGEITSRASGARASSNSC